MFTGIVEEVGTVGEIIPDGAAIRFRFRASEVIKALKQGESVACNGVCLTAEAVFLDGFTATAVPETLSKTCLGELRLGHGVNLESAVKAGAPLGGHMVQGHVDGVAEVIGFSDLSAGAGKEMTIRIPENFSRYCISKGSITLHGVSLTIAAIEGNVLRFALVPHTLEHTNLSKMTVGAKLNFEVDLIGKYVEKMMAHGV